MRGLAPPKNSSHSPPGPRPARVRFQIGLKTMLSGAASTPSSEATTQSPPDARISATEEFLAFTTRAASCAGEISDRTENHAIRRSLDSVERGHHPIAAGCAD